MSAQSGNATTSGNGGSAISSESDSGGGLDSGYIIGMAVGGAVLVATLGGECSVVVQISCMGGELCMWAAAGADVQGGRRCLLPSPHAAALPVAAPAPRAAQPCLYCPESCCRIGRVAQEDLQELNMYLF